MPCRRSTPRSQIWKRENDLCANRSVWIPGDFFVDIELGNLYLKRGSRENALQAIPTRCNTLPTIPNSGARLRSKSNECLQHLWAKSLSYEIRLWSDVHEKGLWKAVGKYLCTTFDSNQSS